jgi:hypothetical protein
MARPGERGLATSTIAVLPTSCIAGAWATATLTGDMANYTPTKDGLYGQNTQLTVSHTYTVHQTQISYPPQTFTVTNEVGVKFNGGYIAYDNPSFLIGPDETKNGGVGVGYSTGTHVGTHSVYHSLTGGGILDKHNNYTYTVE